MTSKVNIGKQRLTRRWRTITVAGALLAFIGLSLAAIASDESDVAAWLRPVPLTAKMAEDGWYVWCGSIAKDDGGVYHLFYARWKKSLGFGSWMTSSEIAHATGPSPFGPWTHRGRRPAPRRHLCDGVQGGGQEEAAPAWRPGSPSRRYGQVASRVEEYKLVASQFKGKKKEEPAPEPTSEPEASVS